MRGDRMKRREFLALIGAAAATPISWSHPVHAQSGDGVRRIGVLMARKDDDPEGQKQVEALRQGLRELELAIGPDAADRIPLDGRRPSQGAGIRARAGRR